MPLAPAPLPCLHLNALCLGLPVWRLGRTTRELCAHCRLNVTLEKRLQRFFFFLLSGHIRQGSELTPAAALQDPSWWSLGGPLGCWGSNPGWAYARRVPSAWCYHSGPNPCVSWQSCCVALANTPPLSGPQSIFLSSSPASEVSKPDQAGHRLRWAVTPQCHQVVTRALGGWGGDLASVTSGGPVLLHRRKICLRAPPQFGCTSFSAQPSWATPGLCPALSELGSLPRQNSPHQPRSPSWSEATEVWEPPSFTRGFLRVLCWRKYPGQKQQRG